MFIALDAKKHMHYIVTLLMHPITELDINALLLLSWCISAVSRALIYRLVNGTKNIEKCNKHLLVKTTEKFWDKKRADSKPQEYISKSISDFNRKLELVYKHPRFMSCLNIY